MNTALDWMREAHRRLDDAVTRTVGIGALVLFRHNYDALHPRPSHPHALPVHPQQYLYFTPLPQGQGSLRPTSGASFT